VPRILIVDDEAPIRSLLATAFEKAGYDVRTAPDGPEAVALCAAESFDAVLSDVVMPRMNGHEALTKIKSDPQLKDILVLILTTSKDESDIILSKLAGASSFLSKPEGFQDLTDTLEKFCAAILHNPDVPFQVIGC